MPYVMLPDNFNDFLGRRVGTDSDAYHLYVDALVYSARNYADGAIPRDEVPWLSRIVDSDRAVKVLVESALWTETEGGYQISDYLLFLEPAGEAHARRESRLQRDREYQRDKRAAKGKEVFAYRKAQADACGMSVLEWLEEMRADPSGTPESSKSRARLADDSETSRAFTTHHSTTLHDTKRVEGSGESAPAGTALARDPSGSLSQPGAPYAPSGRSGGVKLSLEGDESESFLIAYGLDPAGRERFERIVRESGDFGLDDIDPYEEGEEEYEGTWTGSVTDAGNKRDIAALGRSVAEEFGEGLADNREVSDDREGEDDE